MIAAPWYLFAAGVGLVVVGLISGVLFGPGRSASSRIDGRLSDAEITKRLRRQSTVGFSGFIVFVGLLCLLVSACWRLLRLFL